jgi:cell wall-associated NlpC family hydrolase
MYVGNGMMVDAPHTGAVVEVVPVWWSDLAGFGRVHR